MSNERVRPLFEDASAPSELRDFVTMARSDGPTQAELDQLAKRLAPVLGVSAGVAIAGQAAAIGSAPVTVLSGAGSLSGALPSAASSGAANTAGAVGGAAAAAAKAGLGATAGKVGAGAAAAKAGLLSQVFASTGAKLVALGVGVSVAGVGAWELQRDVPSVKQRPVAAEQAAAPVPSVEQAPSQRAGTTGAAAAPVEEPIAEPAAPEQAPVPALAVPATTPRWQTKRPVHVRPAASLTTPTAAPSVVEQAPVVAAPAPEPATVEPPVPSELALIRQAQAARANAGQALALLAQHQQQYPRGALAQEREVLAIEILLKAGLKVQAEARARQFEASFSGSAHLPHVKALLGRAGAQ